MAARPFGAVRPRCILTRTHRAGRARATDQVASPTGHRVFDDLAVRFVDRASASCIRCYTRSTGKRVLSAWRCRTSQISRREHVRRPVLRTAAKPRAEPFGGGMPSPKAMNAKAASSGLKNTRCDGAIAAAQRLPPRLLAVHRRLLVGCQPVPARSAPPSGRFSPQRSASGHQRNTAPAATEC